MANQDFKIKNQPLPGQSFLDLMKIYKQRITDGDITNRKDGMPLSEHTVKTRSAETDRFIELAKSIKTFTFDDDKTKEDYRIFVQNIKKYFVTLGLNDQTIYGYTSRLRMILAYFLDIDEIPIKMSFLRDLRWKKPSYDVIVMTEDQTRFVLQNYKAIREDCTKKQAMALDYWVTGLILAPRKSDMAAWKEENLFKKGNGYWISYRTNKTEKKIEVPVPDFLIDIFKRNVSMYNGYLLPQPLNTDINEKLQTIAKRYDIFHNDIVTWKKEGGVSKEFTMKGYEAVAIHKARATAITNMFECNASVYDVIEFSGHTKNSASLGRYVRSRDNAKLKLSNAYTDLLLLDN